MAVDLRTRRAVLGNTTGGWSGPAVKPLALRLVWQTARAVDVPVIGCGGVTSARDVVEYMLAGATAVQVGTATFTRPQTMSEILAELPELLAEMGVHDPAELVGGIDRVEAKQPIAP
jgi:dihydroorotate dehydrogenase (NAD+) catalytic subunit